MNSYVIRSRAAGPNNARAYVAAHDALDEAALPRFTTSLMRALLFSHPAAAEEARRALEKPEQWEVAGPLPLADARSGSVDWPAR